MTDLTITREAPRYDRGALRPRILHIGFGAFARAHPMWFLDRGLDAAGGDWGVVAARLHSGGDALDHLDAGEGGWRVVAADGAAARIREIGCVVGTRHPSRDGPDALPDLIASRDLDVVLLTVTEKGYCQSGGHLDPEREDIRADLAEPRAPGTAIGLLVEGLRRRRAESDSPLTILSCDNLSSNGALLAQVVQDYAGRADPDLAAWIKGEVAFPNSMVDRITPAMDEDSAALLRKAVGADDQNGIVTEPFHQWVIEDRFAGSRPPFAEGGAQLVDYVTPFEEMKLRMLNGAHTFLAHAGRLAGHETVADAITAPVLADATLRLMRDEQAPTLDMPDGVDLAAYAEALMERFANTRLRHRLDQIAQDTSQKVPQRLLAPALANAQAGRDWPLTAHAIASWITALRELPAVADPRHDALHAAACGPDPVRAVLALPDLTTDPDTLIGPVADAHARIADVGITVALDEAR